MKTVGDLKKRIKDIPDKSRIDFSIEFSRKYPALRVQGKFCKIMDHCGDLVFLGVGSVNGDYEMDDEKKSGY